MINQKDESYHCDQHYHGPVTKNQADKQKKHSLLGTEDQPLVSGLAWPYTTCHNTQTLPNPCPSFAKPHTDTASDGQINASTNTLIAGRLRRTLPSHNLRKRRKKQKEKYSSPSKNGGTHDLCVSNSAPKGTDFHGIQKDTQCQELHVRVER